MKMIHKIFAVTFFILLIGFGVLLNEHIKVTSEIQAYVDENQNLTQTVESQDELINQLTKKLSSQIITISKQEDKVMKYDELAKVIDFDKVEVSQLEKANQISDNTPLDLASATDLVKYADQYDIPYSLVLSIIDIESGFDQNLVGRDQDRGYMQIIPSTEKWLANEYGKELGLTYDPDRIFEPEYNLALGIKYLDILMNAYGANYDRILSEYNRGPYNLQKYFALNKTYSTSYSRSVLGKESKYVAFN